MIETARPVNCPHLRRVEVRVRLFNRLVAELCLDCDAQLPPHYTPEVIVARPGNTLQCSSCWGRFAWIYPTPEGKVECESCLEMRRLG